MMRRSAYVDHQYVFLSTILYTFSRTNHNPSSGAPYDKRKQLWNKICINIIWQSHHTHCHLNTTSDKTYMTNKTRLWNIPLIHSNIHEYAMVVLSHHGSSSIILLVPFLLGENVHCMGNRTPARGANRQLRQQFEWTRVDTDCNHERGWICGRVWSRQEQYLGKVARKFGSARSTCRTILAQFIWTPAYVTVYGKTRPKSPGKISKTKTNRKMLLIKMPAFYPSQSAKIFTDIIPWTKLKYLFWK
jgi:hypothetical protein